MIFWGPCRTPCDRKRRSPETLTVYHGVPNVCRDAPCTAPTRSLIHLPLPPLEVSQKHLHQHRHRCNSSSGNNNLLPTLSFARSGRHASRLGCCCDLPSRRLARHRCWCLGAGYRGCVCVRALGCSSRVRSRLVSFHEFVHGLPVERAILQHWHAHRAASSCVR